MIKATVIYFTRGIGQNREVLLGIKTRKICRNKLIGPGGKHKKLETAEDCAVREVKEEVSVLVEKKNLKRVACIDFLDKQADGHFRNCQRVTFFIESKWKGAFKSNRELRDLKWFKVNQAPLEQMMLGHLLWFQLVFEGYYILGRINYGFGRKGVESFKLKADKLA